MSSSAAASLVLAALCLTGCAPPPEDPSEHVAAVKPIPILTDTVITEPWPDTWQAPGFVRKRGAITLSSQFAGVVRLLAVKRGDRVKAGAALIEFDTGDISDSLKEAETATAVTPESLKEAGEAVEVARLKSTVATAEPARSKALKALEAALAHQAELRARRSSTEAARHAAQSMREASVIRAPSAGRILNVFTEPGKLVAASAPLIRMEATDFYFETTVESTQAERVVAGAEVTIALDRGKCEGVAVVDAVTDSETPGLKEVSATLPCKAAPLNTRGVMTFRGSPHTVISVAEDAVLRQEGRASVYLVEDGLAKLRRVTVAGKEKGRLEVIAGLAPGTKVMRNPPRALKDNTPVAIIAPGKPPAKP